MEPKLDIRVYLAILRRRYLLVLVPAAVITVLAIAFAYWLSPTYEASATILVESQQIPDQLVASTVTSNAAARIQLIEQRLLTRDNLLQISDKFGLFKDDGDLASPTTIVDKIRQSVAIDQIDVGAASHTGADVIGFTVKFRYRDATIAARVTNELVTSILSQNIKSRLSRASETSDFFKKQQDDLGAQLLAFETKIADYKRANDGALPETLSTRREQLAQITTQLADVDVKLQTASLPDSPDILGTTSQDVQQLGYTLKAKQLDLASLTDERDQLEPLAEKGDVPQNRIRDLDRQIAIDQLNIEATTAQIAAHGGTTNSDDAIKALKALHDQLSSQASALNDSISKTPLVEVELNAMNRDYESLQTEYRQAQAKLEDALTSERLEQDRQSERFEVIEQATVPDKPAEPNRPRIMLLGSLGGIALGIGLLALVELLDRRLYSAGDLERKLQICPIAIIPYLRTPGDLWRRYLRFAVISVVLGSTLAASLLAINYYYLPVDLIVARAWQTAGSLIIKARSGTVVPHS